MRSEERRRLFIAAACHAGQKEQAEMQQPLFLEDLHIGKKFVSGGYQLSERQIIDFAVEYDPQPFHTHPGRAIDSFFNGHAASGWQTAAVTMRLLVSSVPFDFGIIGLGADIVWPAPVRPGDILQVEAEIIAVHPSRSKSDRGVVTLLVNTRNQYGEAVQTLKTKILVFSEKSSLLQQRRKQDSGQESETRP